VKKTKQQTYRLSEEDKKALEKLSEEMNLPAATIVSVLASRFVQARKEYGTHLIWPPEFNYYPVQIKSAQDNKKT